MPAKIHPFPTQLHVGKKPRAAAKPAHHRGRWLSLLLGEEGKGAHRGTGEVPAPAFPLITHGGLGPDFYLPCLPCLPPRSAGVTDDIMLPKSQEKAVQLPGAIKLTCYRRVGLTPHARAAEGQTGQAEASRNGRLSGSSGESVCLGPESSPSGSLGGQRRASLWIQSSQTGTSFSEPSQRGIGAAGQWFSAST